MKIDNKVKHLLVSETESTLKCMKKLDNNANKILFVVGENDELIGSLTDGDIRRWILAGKDLKDNVSFVCHKRPITIDENYETDKVKSLMLKHKIECIPVITENNIIKDAVFWTELFQDEKTKLPQRQINTPVVIMAGGFGKRLEPFTTILPKPLIPVGDKSIVEHIIDKFLQYGVDKFYMSLNHKSKIIKSYFEEIDKDYDIRFEVETKPLGTAGSIKLFKNELSDTFVISNCDIIIYADYAEIIDFHKDNGYDLTLVSSMMHFKVPYGICQIDKGGKLIEIIEKPEYNFLISTGMYVMDKKCLDLIPDNEFYHITHLMEDIKKKGGTIGVYPISENSWVDTGEWKEYNKTVKKLTT